jgi:hypothetical protein
MRSRQRVEPRARRLGDERGSTLIEVVVGSMILVVAVLGVIGSMGAGMGLVGHSRQRSAGAGVAQERIERARNIAYEDVALNEDPEHNSDPDHPDNKVTEDNRYRLKDGSYEPLVIDLANGGLKHLDDPFTLANTDFTVHQYVTWVDDPEVDGAENYKRVTVVVKWKFPVRSGSAHEVVESTFVSDSTVTIGTPPPEPSGPVEPPGPGGGDDLGVGNTAGQLVGELPAGNGQCPTDSSDPTLTEMDLLSGSGTDQGYLNTTSVQIRFNLWDAECHPLRLFMKNADTTEECLQPADYDEVYSVLSEDKRRFTVTWTVRPADGQKTLCAYGRNKADRATTVWATNVVLDQTRPTVPAGFSEQACNEDGNDRVVTLTWEAATDTNLYGYRLYRSLESTPFQLIQQTGDLAVTDSTLKNYSSVRYLVRAYDKAGNESPDSAVLSYARNQC